jgi:hypothetical protein
MKKYTILLWILVLSLILCACGSSESSDSTTENQTTTTFEAKSDRDLIYNLVKSDRNKWYSSYNLDYWFISKELDTPFFRYNAKIYQYTWTVEPKGEKSSPTSIGTVELYFIVKSGIAYHIETPDGNFKILYEIDFDNDGQKELIYFLDLGSYPSSGIFYIFESAVEEPVYIGQFYAYPQKIENNDLVVLARTKDGKQVNGILKYRLIDGKKDVYIDAGEYSDQIVKWY